MALKLLIDSDVVAFRAGFAAEKTKYLVEDISLDGTDWTHYDDAKTANERKGKGVNVWSRKEVQPEENAINICDAMMRDIRDHYAAENPTLLVALSGVGNFRYGFATRASYKGNRSGATPPVHLRAVREHLVSAWGAVLTVGQEADDQLGIWATQYPQSVIVSIDKDLRQLPGRHYDFTKKEEVSVTPKEATVNFFSQVLSGDSTDNVPGLTGIGPVKARKALAECRNPRECWEKCVAMYKAEFGNNGYDYCLEAANLVFVRRQEGVNFVPPAPAKAAA